MHERTFSIFPYREEKDTTYTKEPFTSGSKGGEQKSFVRKLMIRKDTKGEIDPAGASV